MCINLWGKITCRTHFGQHSAKLYCFVFTSFISMSLSVFLFALPFSTRRTVHGFFINNLYIVVTMTAKVLHLYFDLIFQIYTWTICKTEHQWGNVTGGEKKRIKKHHMKQSLLMEFGVIWCQGESTGRGFVICLSFSHTHSHTHTRSCLQWLWKMGPAEWKRDSFGSRSLHAFLL